MAWHHLRLLVPASIIVVGALLIAPLVAPTLSPVVEAPTGQQRPPTTVPTATPATTGNPAAGPSPATAAAPAPTVVPSTPVPTPTQTVYRASAIDNLKIEPRALEVVRLGRIESGTLVRMALKVAFNSPLSTISGVPDLDVQVTGPTGTVASYPGARDGVRVDFQSPAAGEYELRLDNTRSRINAKRVTIQFG